MPVRESVRGAQGMEEEHLRSPDSERLFTRSVGGQPGSAADSPDRQTSPKQEWMIVVEPEAGRAYSSGRVGTPLGVYQSKMATVNERLRARDGAQLIIEEAVGARLYTGPMVRRSPAPMNVLE